MRYESFRLLMFSASTTATIPVPRPRYQPASTASRTYQVSYQLKRGTMYLGQVTGSFFVPCTRRFPTDELNVILAELYQEVGPAHDLLGIEIIAICRLRATGRPEPCQTAASYAH